MKKTIIAILTSVMIFVAAAPVVSAEEEPPAFLKAARAAAKFLETETVDGHKLSDNLAIESLYLSRVKDAPLVWRVTLRELVPGGKPELNPIVEGKKLTRFMSIDEKGTVTILTTTGKRRVVVPKP